MGSALKHSNSSWARFTLLLVTSLLKRSKFIYSLLAGQNCFVYWPKLNFQSICSSLQVIIVFYHKHWCNEFFAPEHLLIGSGTLAGCWGEGRRGRKRIFPRYFNRKVHFFLSANQVRNLNFFETCKFSFAQVPFL